VGAQQDHPPGLGDTPTTGWIPGEYVVDTHELALGSSAAPGTYQIEVGMYDPRSGQRLRVSQSDGADPGDRVILGTIVVK
ncbi:MAG TPA: hypothetical protein VFZ25_15540, partial [Chloroflexota bacterium]|nr:hypothetical protein [Chloroflexota bacterium]